MSHFWCVQIHHCDQFPKELLMDQRVNVFELTKRSMFKIQCLSQLYTFGLYPSRIFPSHIQESPNNSDHLHIEILEFFLYFRGPSVYLDSDYVPLILWFHWFCTSCCISGLGWSLGHKRNSRWPSLRKNKQRHILRKSVRRFL